MSSYINIVPSTECSILCGSPANLAHEGIHGEKHPICNECFEEIIKKTARLECPSCRVPLSGMVFKSLNEKHIYVVKKTTYDAVKGGVLGVSVYVKAFLFPGLCLSLVGLSGICLLGVDTEKYFNIVSNYCNSTPLVNRSFQFLNNFFDSESNKIALIAAFGGVILNAFAFQAASSLGFELFKEQITLAEGCLIVLIAPAAVAGAILNIAHQRKLFNLEDI